MIPPFCETFINKTVNLMLEETRIEKYGRIKNHLYKPDMHLLGSNMLYYLIFRHKNKLQYISLTPHYNKTY